MRIMNVFTPEAVKERNVDMGQEGLHKSSVGDFVDPTRIRCA